MKNQAGFSLIEVAIAAALAGLALMYAFQSASMVTRSQGAMSQKLLSRTLLDQNLSLLSGVPGNFPLEFHNGQPLSYIACFDLQGNPATNSAGSTTYVAMSLASTLVSSNVCQIGNFEIHITPESVNPGQAEAVSFYIQSNGTITDQVRTVMLFRSSL